ncbi:MAG: nucleotide exchange factor GrpE [Saprospiraceae bacterium]|nr:nucleotide exchange factor GrpE [Pyrinomonadaceae bacterium]
MDPNQETDNFEDLVDLSEVAESDDESTSVDDFIKELEAKEKDLHITSDTTFIEIAEGFDDYEEMPDFIAQAVVSNGHKTIEPVILPEVSATDPKADTALENEVTELKNRISTMEAERAEIFKSSQRRAKDFEALKARTERERSDTFTSQISNLAVKMLPALDNLDRALNFAAAMPEETRNEFQQFFDGIVLVNQQVNDVLSGMGIEPILTVGRTFDPHMHEAVAIDESTDLPPNTISEEMLRGYRIGEKIIRHSMVKVTKAAEMAAPATFGEIDFQLEADTSQAAVDDAEFEDTLNVDDYDLEVTDQISEAE